MTGNKKIKLREALIEVHFLVVENLLNTDGDVELVSYLLMAVPDRGELVNIVGNPYVVHERAWSVDPDDGRLFCYIRLIPRDIVASGT